MNKKPNLSKRLSRPQTLGGAFGNLMKLFGVRASDADLANRWDEIVGTDLARLGRLSGTKAVGKQFKITIRPTVPAMSMELKYRAEEFKIKIDKYFGYDAVEGISVRQR